MSKGVVNTYKVIDKDRQEHTFTSYASIAEWAGCSKRKAKASLLTGGKLKGKYHECILKASEVKPHLYNKNRTDVIKEKPTLIAFNDKNTLFFESKAKCCKKLNISSHKLDGALNKGTSVDGWCFDYLEDK